MLFLKRLFIEPNRKTERKWTKLKPEVKPEAAKVGCVSPMVISPEFHSAVMTTTIGKAHPTLKTILDLVGLKENVSVRNRKLIKISVNIENP